MLFVLMAIILLINLLIVLAINNKYVLILYAILIIGSLTII